MSDTCIVCLGDLENANALPHPLVGAIKSEDADHPHTVIKSEDTTQRGSPKELIAHLLPCGHDLHNECLKPWVERANSCPICRQSFNQVELSDKVGGPIVSSYAVSDRTQVADIDPSMIVEDYEDEEPDDQPCPVCGDDDNEDVLIQCDGCDTYYHTYCVGLDEVPIGHWFCDTCETQRAIESVCPGTSTRSMRPSHHTAGRRTRGQQRRLRSINQAYASGWARVWQQVWDRLNLDLDFPFDEGTDSATLDRAQRAASHRGGLSQWERRFQVAARHGAASRFRDTASALLDIHAVRERPEVSEPESREELRAWNAFEKAKEIELDPTPKRKRKSVTTSPSDTEPVAEPQRPLKRPRTRRNIEPVEVCSNTYKEEPGSRRSSAASPSTSRIPSAHVTGTTNNGPTFLQSMLKEIETSSAPDESKAARYAAQTATGYSSPHPSSPGASPSVSNHASPRARSLTPPPCFSARPGSPTLLTSKVEPLYPPPEFSPVRSPENSELVHRPFDESRQRLRDQRQSRGLQQSSSPPRSEETSPARTNMPLSVKADLQKMVARVLKPHYQKNTVSKDQYTDINRKVSHMLYDKLGEKGTLDEDSRQTYERLASEEVAKAVDLLTLKM
ncbi:hypothetical protein ACLMJK_004978 [Lecanora helva]